MDIKSALIQGSPALLGLASQLRGENPQGLAQGLGAMQANYERDKRKQAIGTLMDRMGIGGAKKGLLDTLPLEMQQAHLLDMMRPPEPVAGKVIGDKLVHPHTGAVIGDYAPETMSMGDFMHAMGMSESGNRTDVINSEGYAGRVQMGQARLDDFTRANGFGRITPEQYAKNPELQKQAEAWHFDDLAKAADKHASLYGTKINGIPVTREGLMGIAHLGGKGGLDRYVQTGGKYNPADSNGTKLSDYQARFAKTNYGKSPGREKLEALLLRPDLKPEYREYIERKIERDYPDPADEYERYRRDEMAAGRQPMSRLEYRTAVAEAGRAQVDVDVSTGGKLTAGQEAVDKAFADEYVSWQLGGRGADAIGQIAQIDSVLRQLEAGEPLTGEAINYAPEFAQAILAPDSVDARERVEEVVQRNLKEVLGAQFTEREGERLISRAYNPRLKPEQNAARLRRLFLQMSAAAAAKQDMANYFQEHGTLNGYKGEIPSLQSFFDALDEGGSTGSINDVMTPERQKLLEKYGG